ncbi:hypothetical protein CAPTEDRAFT_192364 [Capitella teleta]|uniref:AMOP domain-containing protein n=1 Tax=Capitella teleta TaxID=283909 RepID=R7UBK5_CAPTE|nr:hypothetical protein CAPTEDRAFT_192364 [Capitella teleta]|eukprot:ELU03466.1 hypothetical protein CAPTEDRAFT_192364 [Capitella teleta]
METHFVLLGIISMVSINNCKGYCQCPQSYPIFDLRNADANSSMTTWFFATSTPGFDAVSSQYGKSSAIAIGIKYYLYMQRNLPFLGYDDKCWRSDHTILRYIVAIFPTPVCITGIQTWGYPNSNGHVSNYSLGYIPHGSSSGKYQYYASDRVVEGNCDSTSGAYHKLPPKSVWRMIATPEHFTVSPDWRWEVYGCVKRQNGRRCPCMLNEITLLAVDEMLPSVVMRYMRGGLQQLPPLVNALDLDKEAAQPTSLLSDDHHDTCLDPSGPYNAWHTLVRIPSFPGDTPLRIIGRGIKCDSRHVLVTYPQNTRFCK